MTTIVAEEPLALETQRVSEELCDLLRKVDPSAWRDGTEREAHEHADRITGRLRTLVAADPPQGMRERLGGLLDAIERAKPIATRSPKEGWTAFLREVQPAYEALAVSMRAMALAPPAVVRPTNYTRSIFHVGSGLFALTLLRVVPSRGWLLAVAGSALVAAWTMEIARRQSDEANDRLMRLFGKVAHPHERYRINSSTWYTTALFLLAAFAPFGAAEVGVMVLGVADPIAALVGRRFGRTRLRANRSLEGSLAFFGAATLTAFATLAIFHPLALGTSLILSFAAALSGAVAELFSTRLDDNFTIPTSVAAAVGATAAIVAVAL